MEKKKCILLGSGGLDTQVSMAILKDEGYEVLPIYFDYGQKTAKTEIPALTRYSKSILGVEPKVVSLKDYAAVLGDIWALNGNVEDTFADKEKIFIPGRNIVFLLFSAVIGYYSKNYDLVLSLHKSDTVSGDCKPAFVESMMETLTLGMSTPKNPLTYRILTPLREMHKHEAIQRGAALGVNFAESWSCDDSKEEQCGVCRQCIERKHMFELAGIKDPTIYLQ